MAEVAKKPRRKAIPATIKRLVWSITPFSDPFGNPVLHYPPQDDWANHWQSIQYEIILKNNLVTKCSHKKINKKIFFRLTLNL